MDFNVLKQKHIQALQRCEAKRNQLNKFCDDYKSLKCKLQTIADKTKHEVMIPLVNSSCNQPPVALVPGYIQHTNEILVLLGDNWFVERSSKEAIDIVERRLLKCEEMLNKLNEEKQQFEKWISFTDQFMEENNDLVEIVEQFDEESEKLWKEKHRLSVKRQKELEAQERNKQKQQMGLNKKSDAEDVINDIPGSIDDCRRTDTEFPVKSILKTKNDKSNRKTVMFNESDESIPIRTDAEVYPIPKAVFVEDAVTNEEKPFTGEIVERYESPKESETRVSNCERVSKFKRERRK